MWTLLSLVLDRIFEHFRAKRVPKAGGRSSPVKPPGKPWFPPRPGTIKLNTDAAFAHGDAEICVIARDHNRRVLWIWAENCHAASAGEAELFGVLRACELAKTHNLEFVEFDGDNLSVMESLTSGKSVGNWITFGLFCSVLDSVMYFQSFVFLWTPRNSNVAAHEICKWAAQSRVSGYIALRDLPPLVREKCGGLSQLV